MKCKIDMKDMLLNKPTMNDQTNKWNIGRHVCIIEIG